MPSTRAPRTSLVRPGCMLKSRKKGGAAVRPGLQREVAEKGRLRDVRCPGPVVYLTRGRGHALPQRIVLSGVRVESAERPGVHRVLHALVNFLAAWPDVA